jgi:hypothetical protein
LIVQGVGQDLEGEIVYYDHGSEDLINSPPAQVADKFIVRNIMLVINIQKITGKGGIVDGQCGKEKEEEKERLRPGRRGAFHVSFSK